MPPITPEQSDRWYNSEPIPGVMFGLNDAVMVISGPFRGQKAAVISLAAVEPETIYNVEFGSDGSDHKIAQSCLAKFDDPDAARTSGT